MGLGFRGVAREVILLGRVGLINYPERVTNQLFWLVAVAAEV